MKHSKTATSGVEKDPTPEQPANPPVLPAGLILYRRKRVTTLANASDVSLVRGLRGFAPVPEAREPGGSISIALFSSEAESKAFVHGIELIRADDDVTTVRDWVGPRSGGPLFAVVVHFDDTSDDHLVVYDYRDVGKRAKCRRQPAGPQQ